MLLISNFRLPIVLIKKMLRFSYMSYLLFKTFIIHTEETPNIHTLWEKKNIQKNAWSRSSWVLDCGVRRVQCGWSLDGKLQGWGNDLSPDRPTQSLEQPVPSAKHWLPCMQQEFWVSILGFNVSRRIVCITCNKHTIHRCIHLKIF